MDVVCVQLCCIHRFIASERSAVIQLVWQGSKPLSVAL